jgi:hypothetical protein
MFIPRRRAHRTRIASAAMGAAAHVVRSRQGACSSCALLVQHARCVRSLLACAWFSTTWIDESQTVTWIDVYDDGSAADGPVGEQYLFSFYWAVITLCAKNPIPPVNDGERQFIIAVTMLNRLLFAYIVGQIASLIAALDRQSALVQEKLDQIREYLQWRGTPKELSVRIKRYYEFFCACSRGAPCPVLRRLRASIARVRVRSPPCRAHGRAAVSRVQRVRADQKQAVFDEKSILKDLSPALHAELIGTICADTISRLPLFAKLSPDFQKQIFPYIKPLSFDRGDYIFRAGVRGRPVPMPRPDARPRRRDPTRLPIYTRCRDVGSRTP